MSWSRGDALRLSRRPTCQLVAAGETAVRSWPLRPMKMLRVVILLLIVGQLGRIPVLSTGTNEAPLLVNDICLLALIAVTFIGALAAESFEIDSVGGLMIAFTIIGLSSALLSITRYGLSGVEVIVSLAYLARWFTYFTVYLVVINIVRGDDVMDVWRSLETMMLIFSAFGIFQSIFLPHFAQLVYPDSRVYVDWDEQGHRLVSTMLEPNIAGSMIMLMLLVNVAQLAGGERVPLWKPLVFLAALFATLSRSSFLGLAVGLMIVLAVRGISRRMMRFGIVTGVLLIAALPKLVPFMMKYNKLSLSDGSAMSRVVHWLLALQIWADHPVFGIGFNTFGYVVEHYGGERRGAASFSSDGGLLFIAVMTGIVGLAVYVGMLVVVFRRCRRVWRSPESPAGWRALAVGIGAGIPAIIVHAAFVNSILTPFVMEMLWVLWALAFVMAKRVPIRQGLAKDARLIACSTS